MDPQSPTTVELAGVPETMLWTLYNRASEAKRSAGYLRDPDAIRIYDAIAYDYARSFGKPHASHAMRSRLFDDTVRPWLARHPGGTVVELGAGLETQFQRCDDGRVTWLCVDVPESIAVRTRFLPPTERCRYIAKSALDLSWMDEVDAARGVLITAQGLLMYFEEADVKRLLVTAIERFPGAEILFDAIPPWFSRKTLAGFAPTKHYTAPRMPWGASRDELPPLLRRWSPRIADVSVASYGFFRGWRALMVRAFAAVPGLRNVPPTIVHLRAAG